jgi:hypothetical protein
MTQADRVLSTPPTNTPISGDLFRHVGSIELPLAGIRHFLDALALISEAMDEPHAGAVNVIVHAALDHVRDAEGVHQALFRLTHPDRERFERDGWPGEVA